MLSILSSASSSDLPGAFSSLSGDVLNRAAQHAADSIATDLRSLTVPAIKDPLGLFQIDELKFDDVTIGSVDVSVKADEGLVLSLKDVSNTVAHTHFCAGKPFQCCGELWASASGLSATGLNKIVVNETTGLGQVVTTVRGFTPAQIQIHHKMKGFACELAADGFGFLNGAIGGAINVVLKAAFPKILAEVIEKPTNLLLAHLEQPPAVGLGAEKFKLDNSFVSVDYNNNRLTHYHKGEFKSTVNPKESRQTPPQLIAPGNSDIELGFSDYVFNTLFESLKAEHIGEHEIELPIKTPTGLKVCGGCPVVVTVGFTKRGKCDFMGGTAVNHLNGMKFALAVKTNVGINAPLFTVTVDAAASIAFALTQDSGKAPQVKATLALDSFQQKDVISVVGEINTDDLNRDINAVLGALLEKINTAVPALPILSLPGWKYENPSFVVDNHQLLISSNLVQATDATQIVV